MVDMELIVSGVAFCGLGGAIGGLIGASKDRKIWSANPRGRPKYTYAKIVAIVGAIAAIPAAGLEDRVARATLPPGDVELFGKEVQAIPALQERVRDKPAAEVRATVQQLATAGLSKLDDDSMLLRAQIFAHLLAQADTPLCGGLAAGTISGEDLMQLIAKLPAEERKGWLKTARAAVELEVASPARTAAPEPAAEQLGQALYQLTLDLPRDEANRLFKNLGDMKKLAPAEACWTGRRLYELINQAPPPVRSLLARGMALG
ncbi:MAG TPA: hypothetical protein VH877_24000 [Polyangia bacterium]|jgi:hypothetical protein|nr:hypothetical protein [Polyangia bacterium]